MGVPQIVQPVWNATARAARAQRLATARSCKRRRRSWPTSSRRSRRETKRRRRCASSWRLAPRCRAAGRACDAHSRHGGLRRRGARPNRVSARSSAPGDEPAKVWGTDGRALRGIRLRITDAQGRVLPAGRGRATSKSQSPTMFEGYVDHPDWTAAAFYAGRLVSHRRPRHASTSPATFASPAACATSSTAAARRFRSPRWSSC